MADMPRRVCAHRLPDIESVIPAGFVVATHTSSREDLRNAIGALDVAGLVLDLDQPDAIDAVVTALELKSDLAVVGITGSCDVRRLESARRAGCTQFTTAPLTTTGLAVALHGAMSQTGAMSPRSQRIVVLGATGGAGSTTIAGLLATELARITKEPVALFDLDLDFGGVGRSFDLQVPYTIADLARVGAVDSAVLEKTAARTPSGVHVFARPHDLQEVHEIDDAAITNILRVASQTYHMVLLDLSHDINAVTGAAIENCDTVLLVMQLTVPALDNARRIMDAIRGAAIGEERIEVVVNRFRKNTHACTVDMVKKHLGRSVCTVVPNDYHAVRSAIDTGKPVGQQSPVHGAIRALAARLAGLDDPPRPRTWLSRLGIGR